MAVRRPMLQIAASQQEQKDAFLQKYLDQLRSEKEEGERIKQAAVSWACRGGTVQARPLHDRHACVLPRACTD